MSHSQHPVALRIERRVGGAARLLATVMALPLVDGIFPALVLAGALDGPLGILEIGLLVFGGSATVAVILAEMDGTRRAQVRTTLAVGVVVIALAAIESALAPTIASLLDLAIFERFAALVILAVAAKTASARVGEYLPRPAVIIGLGALASLEPAGARLVLVPDPTLVMKGTLAAGVGVAFAVGVAVCGPWLRTAVDIDRFRFGSAVALGVLALSVLGLVPDDAPLALSVLVVTGLLAFDPDRTDDAETATRDGNEPGDPDRASDAVTDGGEPSGIDRKARSASRDDERASLSRTTGRASSDERSEARPEEAPRNSERRWRGGEAASNRWRGEAAPRSHERNESDGSDAATDTTGSDTADSDTATDATTDTDVGSDRAPWL